MPRTRTAEPRRRRPEPASRILVSGASAPLSPAAVRRAADRVLERERRGALLSIAFIGRDSMRALNRRWKGTSAPTDVLAFPLRSPTGDLAGDIYICPWQAARHARALGLPVRQELTRLVVHGVLHVLGYDHPEAGDRTRSAMWRRQERYVRGLR